MHVNGHVYQSIKGNCFDADNPGYAEVFSCPDATRPNSAELMVSFTLKKVGH